jgi:hypothetical protein
MTEKDNSTKLTELGYPIQDPDSDGELLHAIEGDIYALARSYGIDLVRPTAKGLKLISVYEIPEDFLEKVVFSTNVFLKIRVRPSEYEGDLEDNLLNHLYDTWLALVKLEMTSADWTLGKSELLLAVEDRMRSLKMEQESRR